MDTNHVASAMDADGPVQRRIRDVMEAGHRVGTAVPVLCEFEVALQRSARQDANRRILTALLQRVRVWPIDPPIARIYEPLALGLKARGRVLSQVDMMVASLALSLDATVLTTDRDFEAIPSLRVEDWTA